MLWSGAEHPDEPRTDFLNTRPGGCKRKNPNTVAAALLRPIKLPDRHGRRPDTARETPCYLRARSGLFSRVRDRRARWEGHRRRPATYCDHGYFAVQIGRASCRERVCQYVSISVGAGSLKKKKKQN